MGLNLSFQEISERPAGKYIRPGIEEDVTINPLKVNNLGKGDFIELSFTNKNGQTASVNLYFTEKSSKYDMEKLYHLAGSVVEKATFATKDFENVKDLANTMNELIAGKVVKKMKFTGLEVATSKGTSFFKATLGSTPFAENGKEVRSGLVFDPNNRYDLRRLVTADNEPNKASAAGLPV